MVEHFITEPRAFVEGPPPALTVGVYPVEVGADSPCGCLLPTP
jgi:hypothetical protein